MVNRNFSIAIFSIFSLYACNYKKYQERITTNKGSFWDVTKFHNKEYKEPLYSYYFEIDGTCKYYSFKRTSDGKLKRFIIEEGISTSNNWKIMSDTLQLRGDDFLIISNKNKRMLLTSLMLPSDTMEIIESEIR